MEIKNTIKAKLKMAGGKLVNTGFFHIFGSSTINKVIGFVSSWVIVRIISKPEYGVYTKANNIYSFFLLLSGLGIASAVLQICSESNDEKRRNDFYCFGMRFGLKINLLLALLIACVGLFVPLSIEGSNRLLVMMCGLPIALIIPEMQLLYLRSTMQNKSFSKANTFCCVVHMLLSCLFAFVWKAPGLVFANYLSYAITAFFIAKRYNAPAVCRKVRLAREDKKTLFSIALISMLNSGLSQLMYLLDVFVLGVFVPDSSVIASYKIATNIPTAMSFIPSALVVYLYPYFARHKDDRKWLIRSYEKMVISFGLFNICISAGLFLLATPIIRILFGAQYLDAVIPFRILSISYFFSATFRTISGNLIVTQRKLKFNLFMAVISSAMNTALNVIMIQKWQSIGAAIATLVTCFVTGLASTIYLLITFKKAGTNTVESNYEDTDIGE